MRTVDCSSCGAHFALPEDLYERKVAGKKTHVRCKVCGERVMLDGTRGAAAEQLWVVSVDEEDRELSTSQVVEAIKSGELDTNALVWKQGMDDWLTLDRVKHFAPVLSERRSADATDSPLPAQPTPMVDQEPTADVDRSGEPALPHTADQERVGAAEPKATRSAPTPGNSLDLHSLFAVESVPPSSVHLDDSDLMSLPPSDLPSLSDLRPVHAIPKAPRALDDDWLGMTNTGGVVIAPPTLGSLVEVTPEPADTQLVSPEVDTPIGEDPQQEPPDSSVLAETQTATPAPRVRGVLPYVVALGGLAAVAGLFLALSSVRRQGAAATVHDDPARQADSPAPIDSKRPAAEPAAGASSPDRRSDAPADDAPLRPEPRPKRVQNPSSTAALTTPHERATAGSGRRDAEQTELGSRPTTTATATTPDSKQPESRERAGTTNSGFDKGAAISALTAAASAASSCRRGADPSGTAVVLVTFAPSGRVTSANLSGPPFAGTPTGGCIAAQMRAARVPAFAGGYVTVSKRVVIR